MTAGVLVSAGVLGVIVLVAALFFQRASGAFSARGILRVYLYVGSLAGILALAVGLGSLLDYGIARVAGDDFVYGTPPVPVAVSCPPGAQNCEPGPADVILRQQERQNEQRRNEDLIRGLTFAVFGAVFWGAHVVARRALHEEEAAGGPLRRGYLMLGTAVFGLATVILVPTGVYQALSNAVLEAPPDTFRPGADALGGGITALVIWL
ncbi:MAG: hypothetical protein KGQ88_08430, partial [Chloroflexi bacterium]|nr:hypothetical protein [Chloroflexota bacterium]